MGFNNTVGIISPNPDLIYDLVANLENIFSFVSVSIPVPLSLMLIMTSPL